MFDIFVCQFSAQERKLASDNCLFCWCNLFTPMKIAEAGKDWMVSWNQLSGLMKEDGHWVEWNCLMVYLNSPVAISTRHVGGDVWKRDGMDKMTDSQTICLHSCPIITQFPFPCSKEKSEI